MSDNTIENTIDFYNKNIEKFIRDTITIDFRETQSVFLSRLNKECYILDFGCGSGRDTKYFLEQGCHVTAVDGSIELCRAASEYTGILVEHMLFQELEEVNIYDGIWACSSILHLPLPELEDVLHRMAIALKNNGIIYTSFKYGTYQGERNGRYFTDMTEETFSNLLQNIKELKIEDQWITSDVRPGRGDEKWLNIILRKS
jgi:2-polyprenyl-3-methyl-5-hydroxy-6-metoxy-1,4-benzoquinol methylase